MATYQYPGYQNAQAGTIADITLRRGDIAAAGALRGGEIAAQGALSQGAAIGGSLQAATGAIAAMPAQAAARRVAALQEQGLRLDVEGRQKQTDDLKAIDSAYASGKSRDEVINLLPGHLRSKAIADFQAFDKANAESVRLRDEANTRDTEAYADLASKIHVDYKDDPYAAQMLISEEKKRNVGNPDRMRQLSQMESVLHEDPTPDTVSRFTVPLINASPKRREEAAKAATLARETARDANTPGAIAKAAAGGDVTKANELLHPKQPKSLQSENEWLVDGKSTPVIFDPASGARYLTAEDAKAGKAIDPARMKKIPPASAGAVAAAAGSLDEAGLEFAATSYRLTRQLPARNAAQNGAIISRAAKQAAALGNSPAVTIQKQAAYKADAGSLDKLQKMSDAAEAFEQKALGQTDIIAELSKKVSRTDSPMLNSWLLAGKDHVLGDSATHQLFNAVSTFSAEYAKIMEGSTGSAAGSSDSARRASERLISATQGKGSLTDTIALMKREMKLTIDGYGASIGHITERMGGAPSTPAAPATPVSPATTPPKDDGYIYALNDSGKVQRAKAGTKLPSGWTVVPKPDWWKN